MRTGLLVTIVSALAIVTWKEIRVMQRMPRPEMYAYVMIVWVILSLIAELGAYPIAVALGAGIALAMAYTFILTGKPVLVPSNSPPYSEGN